MTNAPFAHIPMMRAICIPAMLVLCISAAQTNVEHAVEEEGTAERSSGIEYDETPFVPNTFIGSIVIEFTVNDGNSGLVEKMRKHYASNAEWIYTMHEDLAPVKGDITLLFDLKNKWNYILHTKEDGTKTAVRSRKPKIIEATTDPEDGSIEQPKIVKTNETRSILGQTCTKLTTTSGTSTWTGWVAEGLALPFVDLMKSLVHTTSDQAPPEDEIISGCVLEFEYTDTEENISMTWHTTELIVGEVPEALFSLAGYKILDFSNKDASDR